MRRLQPLPTETLHKEVDVKQVRDALGLSQAELGRLFSVTKATVWRWENAQGSPCALFAQLLREAARSLKRDKSLPGKVAIYLRHDDLSGAWSALLKAN